MALPTTTKDLEEFFAHLTDRRFGTRKCQDHDLFLVESGLWPLLLEGLEQLARQIHKEHAAALFEEGIGGCEAADLATLSSSGNFDDGKSQQEEHVARARSASNFNALKWLGQYLLRNAPPSSSRNPAKGPTTPRLQSFDTLRNLAVLERERRAFLRRRFPLERLFHDFSEGRGMISDSQFVDFLAYVDTQWYLEGAFRRHFSDPVPSTRAVCVKAERETERTRGLNKIDSQEEQIQEQNSGLLAAGSPGEDSSEEPQGTHQVPSVGQQTGNALDVEGRHDQANRSNHENPAESAQGDRTQPGTLNPALLRFADVWQRLRAVIEGPRGALRSGEFDQGEARKQAHRRALEEEDRRLDRQRRVDAVLASVAERKQRFTDLVAVLRQNLSEEMDFNFPRSAGESSLYRSLRLLLEWWADALRSENVTPGCSWTNLVKFFRSLKRNATETDADSIYRLQQWPEVERARGDGPLFQVIEIVVQPASLTTPSAPISTTDVKKRSAPTLLQDTGDAPPFYKCRSDAEQKINEHNQLGENYSGASQPRGYTTMAIVASVGSSGALSTTKRTVNVEPDDAVIFEKIRGEMEKNVYYVSLNEKEDTIDGYGQAHLTRGHE
ncbi:unnamed protein product [Amoebophrya sp. A25]|nr:unnamed protein product [Amoebophrya sp. A25]|eukprot:GSA25T00015784001.1